MQLGAPPSLLIALMLATPAAAGPAPGRVVTALWSMTRLDLDVLIDAAAQHLEGDAELPTVTRALSCGRFA